jgi:alpha-tubulin suppressor-like RCC1 family protein
MWGQILDGGVSYGIGTGTNAAVMEPTIVSSPKPVASVSIGSLDSPTAFYLCNDGTLYAFGSGSKGQVCLLVSILTIDRFITKLLHAVVRSPSDH